MYTTLRNRPVAPAEGQSRRAGLNRTVLFLGFTSFFMDISSEMVAAVVPLFLTASVGLGVGGFGLYSAGYELANGAFRIVGGTFADRTRRRKETAVAGYGVSAATRAGLVGSALAGLPAIPFLLIDRFGKGIRTGPRDALITLATPSRAWGAAFGIHRTMDAAGALLGPLIAGAILFLVPGSFDSVFVVSLAFGLISVSFISVGVRNPGRRADATAAPGPNLRQALVDHWRQPGFRRLSAAAAGLGLFTVGDGFLYLLIADFAQEGTDVGLSEIATWFAYLSAGTALSYLVFATPVGRLADRVGRGRMWIAGHVLLGLTYVALLAHPTSVVGVAGVLMLLGLFYAATDGMLPALAAGIVPEETRTTGISIVTTVVTVARAIAALAFGLIWSRFGADSGLITAAAGLGAVIVALTIFVARRPPEPRTEPSIDG